MDLRLVEIEFFKNSNIRINNAEINLTANANSLSD